MLYINWKEANETNIPIIDEQHKGIVSIINSFYNFIQNGHGIESIEPTLKILEYYTLMHFDTEEDFMIKSKYPNTEEHQKLHRKLMSETTKIAYQASTMQDPKVVLSFLKKWWLEHINQEDKKYVEHIKKYLEV
jgi:hemerythrin-like metal-binding protein